MLTTIENLVFFQHLPGAGAGAYWKLLDHFPSLQAALNAPSEQLATLLPQSSVEGIQDLRIQKNKNALLQKARRNIEWAAENDVHILTTDNEHYPELLREIRRSPPLLYVKGNLNCLSMPQIAIVGSRSPGPTGQSIAEAFACDLANSGFAITSGLALGIDTCAHRGAVSAGGQTIAVLGCGIDTVYPSRNRTLAADIIAKGGAIVSEFPIGTAANPGNFPQRNRIISGLSSGVLVVEAAIKSGSLITARYALQQNREVFAVPGSINNPLARGCHSLIKDGAKLVETSKDIVDELKGFLGLASSQLDLLGSFQSASEKVENSINDSIVPSELETKVLQHLDYQNTPVDAITERSGLAVGDVMASLLTMELKGIVANTGNGYMRIRESA